MSKFRSIPIQLDDQGHLILPDEMMQKYGLVPGGFSRLEISENGLVLSRSSSSLARIYVEPTNACNLDCSTCMRNVWDEPLGKMSLKTFNRVIQGIKSITPSPVIFFGGIGEPLAHPDIREMVSSASKTGMEVELITNGTLLDENTARWMVESRLSRLWVSIDGATPEGYADIRLGNALPVIIANLQALQAMRARSESSLPKLGIAFVAMKRNIAALPELVRMGKRLGADQFSITNVLPHTPELSEEVLYNLSMYNNTLRPSQWAPGVSLPRMDQDIMNIELLARALKGQNILQIARQPLKFGVDTCPFIEKGSIAIRWDGAVSPCLPLLHTHESYLGKNLRTSHAFTIGNIHDRSLLDLWNDSEYVRLRERLLSFDFSPCTYCNSCEMAEANLEDCYGNTQPTCGGCLWAQGFIQCP